MDICVGSRRSDRDAIGHARHPRSGANASGVSVRRLAALSPLAPSCGIPLGARAPADGRLPSTRGSSSPGSRVRGSPRPDCDASGSPARRETSPSGCRAWRCAEDVSTASVDSSQCCQSAGAHGESKGRRAFVLALPPGIVTSGRPRNRPDNGTKSLTQYGPALTHRPLRPPWRVQRAGRARKKISPPVGGSPLGRLDQLPRHRAEGAARSNLLGAPA